MHVTGNQGIDPGLGIGDCRDFDGVKIGSLSPVVFISDMDRFYSGFETGHAIRSGTVSFFEISRTLLDDFSLLFAELGRQVRIRTVEDCLDGMTVDFLPFLDLTEKTLDHGRSLFTKMPVHAPDNIICAEI